MSGTAGRLFLATVLISSVWLLAQASERVPTGDLQPSNFTREQARAIQSKIASLADPAVAAKLAEQLNGEGNEADSQFISSILASLGSLFSTQEGNSRISRMRGKPEALMGALASDVGDTSTTSMRMLMAYFLSIVETLRSNDHLREQVMNLVKQSAESLASDKSIGQVLSEIAASDVLADLKEEVEDEMMIKSGGALTPPESEHDLVR